MSDKPESSLSQLLVEFRERADASHVIIAGTVLDDWLEAALVTQMRVNLAKAVQTRLFEGYGPLSTFAAKIDVAYAFKVIDDSVVGDFRAIKDIRNAFAHTRNVLHFESFELKPLFQKLTGWSEKAKPRELFDARFKACVDSLEQFVDRATLVKILQSASSPGPTTKS